jgi:hypothetical protein
MSFVLQQSSCLGLTLACLGLTQSGLSGTVAGQRLLLADLSSICPRPGLPKIQRLP